MTTDPVADMLTRIRNAILARHATTEIPLSKLKVHIAEILKAEGYIAGFSVKEEGFQGTITVELKYGRDKASAIVGMKRLSRPGRRLYVRHQDLTKVMNGMGISIISTSRGLLTNRQAEQERIGGELLCEVW
jgi:small subunit ribosomal protein S8